MRVNENLVSYGDGIGKLITIKVRVYEIFFFKMMVLQIYGYASDGTGVHSFGE